MDFEENEKESDFKNILFMVGVLAIAIVAMIVTWAYPDGIEIENPIRECEAQGGEYNSFKGGSICVKDGLIIDMD